MLFHSWTGGEYLLPEKSNYKDLPNRAFSPGGCWPEQGWFYRRGLLALNHSIPTNFSKGEQHQGQGPPGLCLVPTTVVGSL